MMGSVVWGLGDWLIRMEAKWTERSLYREHLCRERLEVYTSHFSEIWTECQRPFEPLEASPSALHCDIVFAMATRLVLMSFLSRFFLPNRSYLVMVPGRRAFATSSRLARRRDLVLNPATLHNQERNPCR